MQYSILGETVQIANELQEECTPGYVLVSKSTHSLVKDLFNFKELKTSVMSAYEIVTSTVS
jgi:class 3 adenylate cyclase